MNKLAFETSNGVLQIVRPNVGEGLPVQVVGGGAADGSIVDGVAAIKATVKDYANSNPLAVVLIDTNGDAYLAGSETPANTATRTSVADNAAVVTLLAANAGRKGLFITNTSSALLYVGMGTVDPSTSNYTFALTQGQTWEMQTRYTGAIEGIWASDPGDGAALITELTTV